MANIEARVAWTMVVNFSRYYPGYLIASRKVGGYTFPGGKLEPGEKPREGALRELYEECGLTPHPSELVRTSKKPFRVVDHTGTRLLCYPFVLIYSPSLGTPANRLPQIHDSWFWAAYHEILRYITEGSFPPVATYGNWYRVILPLLRLVYPEQFDPANSSWMLVDDYD